MGEVNLTPWFGPNRVPAREGVYEVDIAIYTDASILRMFRYSHWSRSHGWGMCMYNPDDAYADRNNSTILEVVRWRGLASQP